MLLADPLPPQVLASREYQQRMRGASNTAVWSTQLPVFEHPRRAVAVVDVRTSSPPRRDCKRSLQPRACAQVARAWAGKPQKIMSVPLSPKEVPVVFKLNEATGSTTKPVVCFKSVPAACRAKWLQTTPKDGSGLPRARF